MLKINSRSEMYLVNLRHSSTYSRPLEKLDLLVLQGRTT